MSSANAKAVIAPKSSSGGITALTGDVTASGSGSVAATLQDTTNVKSVISANAIAGDVTGTVGATTVAKLQGNTVSSTTPSNGQILVYNTSTGWTPAAQTTTFSISGDVTGTTAASTVAKIQGTAVSATAPTTNQVLQYNGTNWVPATVGSGAMSLISTQNITSATTCTFSSIPQTYTHLRVILSSYSISVANTTLTLQINGDTTAADYYESVSYTGGYSNNYQRNTGSVALFEGGGQWALWSGSTFSLTLDIPCYTNGFYKSIISNAFAQGSTTIPPYQISGSHQWNNNSAINKLVFGNTSTATFYGLTVSLYGIS